MKAETNLPSTAAATESSKPWPARKARASSPAVDARHLDADVGEARGGELGAVVVLGERARDAARPQLHAPADGGRHLAPHHDVGNREAPAGPQHAEGLAQHAVLVAGEVDHAVGDDHVHARAGQRDVLDLAAQELDVREPALRLVLLGEGQHLVGHVEPVGLAGGAHALRREQHVDAAAGAEVEHGLAGLQLRERRRIAAAERGGERRAGHVAGLGRVVEVRGDRVARAPGGGAGAAAARGGGRGGAAARAAGAGAQQPPSPFFTRSAAWPYFSRTISFTSFGLAHGLLLSSGGGQRLV